MTILLLLKWAFIVAIVLLLVQIILPFLWILFILLISLLTIAAAAFFYGIAIVGEFFCKVWRKWTS